jgi:hypothetical protein
MPDNEEFTQIAGFGRYQIGTHGSVFSAIRSGRFLKWIVGPNGYPYVQLMADGAHDSTRINIHRLVAEAFIPNPRNLQTVNHKNGIKHDAHYENLEWATYSEQQEHALASGLNSSHGETHYKAKLMWDDVDEIRRLVAGGMMHKDIGAKFGCKRRHITKIANNQIWNRRP